VSRTANRGPSLIVVAGLPRSGTTWLGRLLDSHPRTLYRHEPDSVRPMRELPLIVEGDSTPYRQEVRAFVERLPGIRAPKVAASTVVFRKAYRGGARQLVCRQALRGVKALSAAGVVLPVPGFCVPSDRDRFVLVWKTIESFGRLGLYADALADKRILLILRHPCGVLCSRARGESRNKFGGYLAAEDFEVFRLLLASSTGARWGLSLQAIRAMQPIERMAWATVVSMEKAVEDVERRGDCRVVVYEDLCAHPRERLQELLDFVGLDFAEQTQSFLMQSTSASSDRYYSVFKDPLEAANRWRRELDGAQQRVILDYLRRSRLAGRGEVAETVDR
jgi:hypothetical protein